MPALLSLNRDFDRAVSDFGGQMACVLAPLRPAFLKSVPVFDGFAWGERDGNTCYNAALQRRAQCGGGVGLVPGQLASLRNGSVHDRAVADGLAYLGDSFLNCPEGRSPVALFMQNNVAPDAHWYALCRAPNGSNPERLYFWTGKRGSLNGIQIFWHDGTTIFHDAKERRESGNYPVFHGYYSVPETLRC